MSPADRLIAALVTHLGTTARPEIFPEALPVTVNVRGAVRTLPCVIIGYETNEELLPVRDSYRASVVIDLLTQFEDAPDAETFATSEEEHRAWSEAIYDVLCDLRQDPIPFADLQIYAAFDRGVEHQPAERHAMTRRTWEFIYRPM
jgi:hypothetical protein